MQYLVLHVYSIFKLHEYKDTKIYMEKRMFK